MERKRVSQQTLRRRRLTALLIMLIVLIILICLIASACSKKNGDSTKGDTAQKKTGIVTTVPTTTAPIISATGGIAVQPSTATTTTVSVDDMTRVQSIDLTFYTLTLSIGDSDMPYVTMGPDTAVNLEEKWESSDPSIASVDGKGNITALKAGTCYVTVTSVDNPMIYAEVKVMVIESETLPGATTSATALSNQTQTQAAEATYIQGILIANKSYGLPADYDPGLDATTKSQFDVLASAASADGLNIYLASGYRSYDSQSQIYNNYVSNYGQASADTFSARPGYSEHQTGLAIDVNTIDDSFAGTPEAIWLEQHAHEYGFIIRYPSGKESITGYKYEPWHIRYLGVETATAVHNSGLCLEEYLGITSVYAN